MDRGFRLTDMRPKVNVYTSRVKLSSDLAVHVAELAAMACAQRKGFYIALSGGSLIDILSTGLCAQPLRDTIDWSNWHVFWADERWVPWNSPASNYGLARDQFFSRVNIPPEQIYAIDNSTDPAATAKIYASVLAKVFRPQSGRMPRFDVILLGVGEDGHTASLFPDHPLPAETSDWIIPVLDAPKPPPVRITMTLPLINNARNIFFVAFGSGKADILSKVLKPKSWQQELPARQVKPSGGELQWFIDQAAAANL
jgi:6-phosphogluconolactonase